MIGRAQDDTRLDYHIISYHTFYHLPLGLGMGLWTGTRTRTGTKPTGTTHDSRFTTQTQTQTHPHNHDQEEGRKLLHLYPLFSILYSLFTKLHSPFSSGMSSPPPFPQMTHTSSPQFPPHWYWLPAQPILA